MKNTRFSRLLLLVLVVVCAASCCGEKEIVIVSTNDVHASIDNMPKMMTMVKELREQNDNVLVFDGGDRWTGNPYVDRAEQPGKPIVELMNKIGYDFFALGNHEFDYQQKGLLANLKEFDAQVLCANADFSNTELDEYIKPYEIIDMAGVKVAIVSFIQLNNMGLPSAMPAFMKGIEFEDGVEKSQEFRFLRDSADVVIALTHLGYTDDSVMVSKNDMFDLVVGGHSHTYIANGKVINGTLVTQSGDKLENVGITRLRIKGNKVVSVTNELVSLEGVEPDAEIQKYIDACKADSPLNEAIGKLDATIYHDGLLNIIGDAMCQATGADLSLINSGSIRVDSLEGGNISAVDVYKLEPFNNYCVIQEMTLAQVKDMVKNTLGEHVNGFDLGPSGMRYEIVVDANSALKDINLYDMNGRPLADKTYKMVVSNYVSSAYEYDCIDNKKVRGELIAPILCDAFRDVDTYKGDNLTRVTIKKLK